jgi:hypothetical protein
MAPGSEEHPVVPTLRRASFSARPRVSAHKSAAPTLRRRRFNAPAIVSALIAVVALLSAASSASAAVTTDQPSYAPGSAVTISGDNSDNAGYLPGETVSVNVAEPSGQSLSCSGVADGNGAWSCQVTLNPDASAVGSYTYTATGETSAVSQSGTFKDSGCPDSNAIGNPKPSNDGLQASYSNNGSGTASYTFTSNNESSSNGIPGLIEYCVYTGTLPGATNLAAAATGANGSSFDVGQSNAGGYFDFERHGGDPSNVPFDGSTVAMGTATWTSGTVPSDQTILLHINDPDECSALYGAGTLTCYVYPGGGGGGGGASDLTASKTANPAQDLTYAWQIHKSASPTLIEAIGGGSKTANYTVTVTHDSGTPGGGWKVTGVITITNPNSGDVSGVTVSDKIVESDGTTQDPGASCTVVTSGFNGTIAGGGSKPLNYTCTYSAQPVTSSETNKAMVSWNPQLSDNTTTPSSSTPATAGIDWSKASSTPKDNCVDVTDAFNGGTPTALGTYCVGGSSSSVPASVTPSYTSPTWTLNYSHSVTVPSTGCATYPNTAKFTTGDTKTTGTDNASVEACGPAATGALTMGFWKNTNGQNLIKSYCGPAATGLGNYLAGLGSGSGPFSNAPTSCTGTSGLASYVYNILNGASATDMNKMLKAQMLSTALDVWFSGPGWTSTTVNKVKPPSSFLKHNSLGMFNMDTTSVCPMVDNLSTGTATCQNSNPSTNAVTAGAVPNSPMTMQAILTFASTVGSSPWSTGAYSGSNVWYAGNRTLQNILKNIFDQFNNQLAFSP